MDHKQDCKRILRVLKKAGYSLIDQDIIHKLWKIHSDENAAGWLGCPDDNQEGDQYILRSMEPLLTRYSFSYLRDINHG